MPFIKLTISDARVIQIEKDILKQVKISIESVLVEHNLGLIKHQA